MAETVGMIVVQIAPHRGYSEARNCENICK
jgi:hypothetical protein